MILTIDDIAKHGSLIYTPSGAQCIVTDKDDRSVTIWNVVTESSTKINSEIGLSLYEMSH